MRMVILQKLPLSPLEFSRWLLQQRQHLDDCQCLLCQDKRKVNSRVNSRVKGLKSSTSRSQHSSLCRPRGPLELVDGRWLVEPARCVCHLRKLQPYWVEVSQSASSIPRYDSDGYDNSPDF